MGGKPTAFKHQLAPARIRTMADAIAAASPEFDRAGFARAACTGLEDMELKARVRHVIACLHRALPQPFPRAIGAIRAAVELDGRTREGDARVLRGFAAWPLIDYVGEHGLDHRELSLDALRALTGLFSAEFAIRPFLDRAPEATLAAMRSWTTDPDHHVRRLCSEGTRPLLPWGQRLERFRADPTPVLALLEHLVDDESEYVRRSVANNLNDIAKDHPETVVEVCARWMRDASDDRRRLIAHALRTLVKRGNPDALELLGFGADLALEVGPMELAPAAVREGGAIELSVELRSTATAVQELNIDYAVHFVKANGNRSAKVFKLQKLRLAAGQRARVRKRHSMRAVTTRVHYPGVHTVELLINGQSSARADFELLD